MQTVAVAQVTYSVSVFRWLDAAGKLIGCGTQLEFDHWQAQGIVPADATLGEKIGDEPASLDAQRKAQWGIA